ncbi:uncharacterized protein VICG_00794 [Vittaforma corneae ATCC 50505]|uniref:Uncharacterized protein n=1 Tax=Vittaforma corneae (strain ATCC 50505) TaxID=993615 RepID=L2GMV6_VITCO|nr:uncharacterized protein VICG_00794 [Vittaforma corneae ATCC 50505]ELA42151.1 hypothetical protein VICG_00794 [Vittaforma corneae ATCC 50505]
MEGGSNTTANSTDFQDTTVPPSTDCGSGCQAINVIKVILKAISGSEEINTISVISSFIFIMTVLMLIQLICMCISCVLKKPVLIAPLASQKNRVVSYILGSLIGLIMISNMFMVLSCSISCGSYKKYVHALIYTSSGNVFLLASTILLLYFYPRRYRVSNVMSLKERIAFWTLTAVEHLSSVTLLSLSFIPLTSSNWLMVGFILETILRFVYVGYTVWFGTKFLAANENTSKIPNGHLPTGKSGKRNDESDMKISQGQEMQDLTRDHE